MLLQEQVAFQRENGPEISAVAGAVGDFARPEFGGIRVGEERLRSASLSSRPGSRRLRTLLDSRH